eukprot:m.39783 g.39783  ORF g.39783 m.39783 type:complete len:921 (-) comp5964_c0_seq1:76-2838(-)
MARTVSILAVAVLVACASALHADQAGDADWHTAHVGRISTAHMNTAHSSLAVATRNGVVAALDAPTGRLAWRQVLRADEDIAALLPTPAGYVTVSAEGARARCWNAETGDIVWETATSAQPQAPLPSSQGAHQWRTMPRPSWATAADAALVGHGDVVVLNAFFVTRLGTTGSVVWQQSVESIREGASFRLMGVAKDTAYLVGTESDGASLVVCSLSAATGESASCQVIDAPAQSCHLQGDKAACLGSGTLAVVDLAAKSVLASTKVDATAKLITDALPAGLVGVRTGATESFFHVSGQSLAATKNSISDSAPDAYCTGMGGLLRVSAAGKTKWNIQVLDDKTLAVASTASINLPLEHGAPSFCFAHETSGSSIELFVRSASDNLHLIQVEGDSAHLVWTRTEALASIENSFFVELPFAAIDHTIARGSNIVTAWLARVSNHAMDFVSFLKHGAVGSSDDGQLTRDAFNQHKLIVGIASSGALFGLDSQSGEVVWLHATAHADFERAEVFLLRPGGDQGAQAAILTFTKSGTHLSFFNPITGAEIDNAQAGKLGFDVALSFQLMHKEDPHASALGLLDTSDKLHIMRTDDAPLSDKPMYTYIVNYETGVIRGFSIRAEVNAVEQLWQIVLSPTTETIQAVTARPLRERVSSLGEILSDGSVMYKYLNPNMLGVATLSPYEKGAATMYLYLIDVVTGDIIHKAVQEQVVGPIHLAMSENWLVYHYRSRTHRRFEMGIVELYEGGKPEHANGFSSHTAARPVVLSQTFAMPIAVSTLGVTVTEWGVTAKNILVASPGGHVFALSRNLVNARRPTNKDNTGRAVGLPMYHPLLPVDTRSFLSYNLDVARVSRITTSPSGLESTCLVFAHGLDMFFTPAAPSKKFDALNEDFNHLALIAVLIALIAGTKALSYFSHRSKLKEEWS